MKIIINSNHFLSTSGYGQQCAEFMPLLKNTGHELAFVAFYGQEGFVGDIEGIKVYPRTGSVYGDDALWQHGEDFKADVSISLQDIWPMSPDNLRRTKRWIPILPVDHEPTPPAVLERLKMAYRICSMSKFGKEQLKKEGFNAYYLPHTVNTEIFKPLDRDKVRKEVGLPLDHYIFGMVAANRDNPSRKSFQEVMDAFVMFLKDHPKSLLYMHTQPQCHGGFDILNYAGYLGIKDKLYFTPAYELLYKMDKNDMARVYNTFDCLLSPSTNEGFGVPIIEAQACGKPVIATKFTAMRDHIIEGKTGELVDYDYLRFSPLGAYTAHPDVEKLYKAMNKVYAYDKTLTKKRCTDHMKKEYDLGMVWNKYWVPFLETLELEVKKGV